MADVKDMTLAAETVDLKVDQLAELTV